MSELLDHIRVRPEASLIESLFDRYGLDQILEHYIESGEAAPHYEYVLSTQLRLTPLLAPRLSGLLSEVRETLQFDEATDLFVQPHADINAFALHSLAEGTPHVVSLTSGLVQSMDDDELRFVIGHEVGHLRYRHYRSRLVAVAVGEDQAGNSKLPPLLQRRLATWDRLAELSADRSGWAAVHGKLESIVSSFFKMASGLGPDHLRFDIDAFLGQLEDLQKMKRKELLASFSHPVTPVRVRALQLFGEAGGLEAADLADVDHRVEGLSQLMEFEVTEPLDTNARDLLLSGGLLAAHADGEPITKDQSELLLHLLLPLSADPEATVASLESEAEAQAMFDAAVTWFRENAGEERYVAYRQLAHVVANDGRLHPNEQTFMLGAAEKLGIPAKVAGEILYQVLAEYLQTKASQAMPLFGFGTPGRPPFTAAVDDDREDG